MLYAAALACTSRVRRISGQAVGAAPIQTLIGSYLLGQNNCTYYTMLQTAMQRTEETLLAFSRGFPR